MTLKIKYHDSENKIKFPTIFKHDMKDKISRLWKALKFQRYLGMALNLNIMSLKNLKIPTFFSHGAKEKILITILNHNIKDKILWLRKTLKYWQFFKPLN